MKNRKFVELYETIYNRFKQGAGFLEGDVVKFKSDYKSTDGYKSLTDSVRQRLEDAAQSGYNIRVGKLHTPNATAGALGINLNCPATHADIYEEKSPGNFGNLMTVPVDLLEVLDTGVNLPPVSKNNKRDDSEAPYQTPTEPKPNKDTPQTKEQNETSIKQTRVKKGKYELPKKNKTGIGANKYNDNEPSKFDPLPVNEGVKIDPLQKAYLQILNEETDVDINDEVLVGKALDHDDDITSEEDTKLEEYMFKPECWNKEKNTVVDECWNEDGSMKAECWQGEEMVEDTPPGQAVAGVVAPEEREQTSAL